jgi:hypothetical protein
MMNEVKRKQKGSSCLPVKEGNKGMNLNWLFPWEQPESRTIETVSILGSV